LCKQENPQHQKDLINKKGTLTRFSALAVAVKSTFSPIPDIKKEPYTNPRMLIKIMPALNLRATRM
jgi:hypothetical protein